MKEVKIEPSLIGAQRSINLEDVKNALGFNNDEDAIDWVIKEYIVNDIVKELKKDNNFLNRIKCEAYTDKYNPSNIIVKGVIRLDEYIKVT